MTALAALVLLASCDEGRIYPTAADDTAAGGVTARLRAAQINGLDTWPAEYKVAFATFRPGDEYAVAVKNLDTDVSTDVDITLSGLSDEVATAELCVLDGLRRRVATMASADINAADGARLDIETIDAGMFATIQQEVFTTTCANCHGASNSAAAGLYLTPGSSYESLVGVASTVVPGNVRVTPGDAASSLLYRVLAEPELTAAWHYDHSAEVTSATTLNLIRSWIDNDAKK